jgi:hypothetical protein
MLNSNLYGNKMGKVKILLVTSIIYIGFAMPTLAEECPAKSHGSNLSSVFWIKIENTHGEITCLYEGNTPSIVKGSNYQRPVIGRWQDLGVHTGEALMCHSINQHVALEPKDCIFTNIEDQKDRS